MRLSILGGMRMTKKTDNLVVKDVYDVTIIDRDTGEVILDKKNVRLQDIYGVMQSQLNIKE
jgi:hypothetical protein